MPICLANEESTPFFKLDLVQAYPLTLERDEALPGLQNELGAEGRLTKLDS